MQRTQILTCLAGLTLLWGSALAQPQPVFSASYDEGFDGSSRLGKIAAILDGKPELAPGRTGKALKSGPGTGCVDYPTAGLITPAGGTVEMWVCPLDWKPQDREFHVFFDTRNEGALYLYKYYESSSLLTLTCANTNGPYASSAVDISGWQPGQWHHIAGTWSPLGVITYVDGKATSKIPTAGDLPLALGERFRIGDHPWHLPRQSASLIDEVRIYDRPLSAAHIAAHSAGNDAFTAPLSADLATLTLELQPETFEVVARIGSGGADVEDARLSARCAAVRPGGHMPASGAALRFAAGQAAQTLVLPARDPGEYEVLAVVLLDGVPAFELRRPVVIPETSWRGNRDGLEDRVIPPWTPLQAGASRFACWGRETDFGAAALPVQITSAGEPLLARPITITATVAGKPVVWTRQVLRAGAASATRAEWSGELVGKAGELPVRLQVALAAEYDGVLVVDLSGTEFAGLPLDQLSLEIPVKAERALYRHRWGPEWAGLSGSVPAGAGVVDQAAFIPYAWLGDNDRGLFWFCESDQFWPQGEGENAFETVRGAGEVALRLNLLTAGQQLPADWIYRFGLQATPVKPLAKDWRKWRLLPAKGGNVSILWPTPNPDSLRYYGYPEAATPELFTQGIAALHAKAAKAVPYLCLSFVSAACPEWPFFAKTWAMGSADSGSSDVAAYGAPFAMASPVGTDYADFIVGKTTQFAERYGIDGLYHDNTHPYSSPSLEAGCGYLRNGKRRPTYPILGYRALYRRMYNVVKAWPRETFTMAHMSGKVTIPILAYEDSYLDGEHFRGRVRDSYMDMFTLDTFRAEFMGRQWGIMPYFLPEFDAEHAALIEPTRGLMALLLAHDVGVWAIWCNPAVVDEAYAALDDFGTVDAEFLPYFAAAPPAATDLADVIVSGYRRADGRVLLVVANLSRAARSGAIRLQPAGLKLASVARVLAWPERTAVPLADQQLSVDVPGLGYRLLVVEPAP
jgi:hypothetical protein